MTRDVPSDTAGSPAEAVEPLYRAFLSAFYEENDRAKAAELAPRLAALLAEHADVAGSIRGDEIAALLAELRGDRAGAITARERELRRILQLHSVSVNRPEWDAALRRYDHRDVADRIDLLAILYAESGDPARAIATLEESAQYCAAHGVTFDGQELLDDLRRRGEPARPVTESPPTE